MQAILTQEKYIKALKGESTMPTYLTHANKNEMMDKANSVNILYI